jgi:uncharacterized membrane protein YbhN (UPF0104 family)
MPRLLPAHRRALGWLVRVGVSLGIVVYILVDVDRGDLLRTLSNVRPQAVVLALALYLVGQVMSGYKWSLIGRSVGLVKPVAEYIRFYFIGMFFNLFGPSTLGGDVVRALYLGEGRRPGLALNSVIFDRASGLALLVALGAVGLLLFPGYGFPWPLTTMLVGGGLALLLGWWTCPLLVRLLPPGNRVRRLVEEDLGPFWRDHDLLLRVAVVSVVFHLIQVTVQFVLARSLGIALPFSYCLILHPVVSVMMALPVSVSGFGVREGGYLYFLTRIDVDDSIAVTMGLLWFAVSLLAGLLGGLIFLASGAELPRLRARPETESRVAGRERGAPRGSGGGRAAAG